MNDRYKFSGKRVDNGEWVYGSLVVLAGCRCYIKDDSLKTLNPRSISTEGWADIRCFEVDPSTVGQYTGLKDKNGKEIYEGDVLDCQDRIVYVEWNDPCGAWDSKFIKYVREVYSSGIDNANWKYRTTVIGNVHDNPELMQD